MCRAMEEDVCQDFDFSHLCDAANGLMIEARDSDEKMLRAMKDYRLSKVRITMTNDITKRIDDLRRDINDLKPVYADDLINSARIHDALNDLLHAQIMIDNVLM